MQKHIISLSDCSSFPFPLKATLVLGNGTGSKQVKKKLQQRGLDLVVVDETGTTLEARQLYFIDNPPKGFLFLLPQGLRLPPKYLDDYAAYAIALRYLKSI